MFLLGMMNVNITVPPLASIDLSEADTGRRPRGLGLLPLLNLVRKRCLPCRAASFASHRSPPQTNFWIHYIYLFACVI